MLGPLSSGTLTWNTNGTLAQLDALDGFNMAPAQNFGNSQSCAYTHDDLGRLSAVDCGASKWGQSFTYGSDNFGNINWTTLSGHLGTTFTQFGYDPATNHYTGTPTYDLNGNLLSDVAHTYTWDSDGNLYQIDSGTAMVYDAFDRRVEQPNGSVILYGPDGSKLAVMSGQAVTKAFVPLPGGATAVYQGANLAWYRHPDWLGSSRLASTPATRTVYYDGAYSPFGETIGETGTADRNFTGQNQDLGATDEYDFMYRQYHATQGRWIQPDPAGMASVDPANPQTWNRYAYVNNSPLNSVDELGLSSCNVFNGSYEGSGPNPFTNCDGSSWTIPPTTGTSNVGTVPNVSLLSQAFEDYAYGDSGRTPWSELPPFPLDAGGGGGGGINVGGIWGSGQISPWVFSAKSAADTAAWSVQGTWGLGSPGAAIGLAIGGPPGAAIDGYIGNMIAIGLSGAWVPKTNSLFVGPVLSFTPGGNGTGGSATKLRFPNGQSPISTLKGLSGSMSLQPLPWAGSTVMKSPGQAPVVGPSFGTKVPLTFSASYGFCVWKCHP